MFPDTRVFLSNTGCRRTSDKVIAVERAEPSVRDSEELEITPFRLAGPDPV